MSPKHRFVAAAVSAVLLAALACSAHAQTTHVLIDVDCAAFRKNPNGSWTVTRKTEVKYGVYSMYLEETTFRKKDINVFGVELASVLDERCIKPSEKK